MLIARLRSFVRALLFRGRVEGDMDREWAFHLDARIDDLVAQGVSPAEAARRVRREFGDAVKWKEEGREARGLRFLDEMQQDVVYAWRQMAKAPGFTLVAMLTLALGIGANTAIFSVVNAVLLRPLPYDDSDRLVKVWSTMPGAGLPRSPSSLPDYREWRAQNHTFVEMGAYSSSAYNLTGRERPERVEGVRVTPSLWRVLGTRPMLGRIFGEDTEQWGRRLEVVLSHSLWQRRLAADPNIIGTTVRLDEESYTIVGVMPASFQFPTARADLWTPIAYAPEDSFNTRSNHFLDILGRLKTEAAIADAQADLSVVAEQIGRVVVENAGLGVALAGWQEAIVGDVRGILWLLLGAVGLVALIACANVANLLLARASSRRAELGVRVALGAARYRLVRQLLTESFVLAGFGAMLGVALAYGLTRMLSVSTVSGIPRLAEASLDGAVLLFTAALTVATAFIFGLWPAWQASAIDASEGLKSSARTATSGRASMRVRNLLIVAEVSGSLVLLVAAGLLILSLVRVQQVDPGFGPDHLLTMDLTLPPARYSTQERIVGFTRQMLERLAALPGVSAAGLTTALPLTQSEWGKYLTIDGRPSPPSLAQVPIIKYRQVTPDYFATLRARLGEGRFLSADDGAQRPAVAIVNEAAARHFWPGQSPIGARVRLGPPESLAAPLLPKDFAGGIEGWRQLFPWVTVVGVVGDFRHSGLDNAAAPELFVPFAQGGGEQASSVFYLVVRTTADPLLQRQAIETVVHGIDPRQPVADVLTMEARLADSLARRHFTLILFGTFAATAVALALVGLYGVLAYAVTQRRKELGIRAALGANRGDLSGLVVGHGMRLAVVGVLIGLVLAASLSRLIRNQLFNVEPIDLTMYAGTALLLLICAALACWIPSRRAARLDPIATLRCD